MQLYSVSLLRTDEKSVGYVRSLLTLTTIKQEKCLEISTMYIIITSDVKAKLSLEMHASLLNTFSCSVCLNE